jgi:hypothetical protein
LTQLWPGARGCRQLSRSLAGAKRAAIYLGFGSNVPPGLQELALDEFSRLGSLVSYRRIGSEGVAAVFDLQLPPTPWTLHVTRPTGRELEHVKRPAGCVAVQRAGRW